jgi:NAD(P)-dependent dehydrogenase (short-subunit alcohol dehydrogenase family)
MQVNNAAILVRHAWDEATYKETLAVDVAAPLLITEQLAPLMPHGSLVIMVSSGACVRACVRVWRGVFGVGFVAAA